MSDEVTQTEATTETASPASYDEWVQEQPEEIQVLIDQHITGLRNTVQATRKERDDLAKQLRDVSKDLEQGSKAREAVDAMSAQLEAAEQRAMFFEEASKSEIGCSNPRLAYVAARQDDLIDARGRIDWAGLRQIYPELFRRIAPASNAGAGTQNPQPAASMNDFIRRAAGR